MGFLGVLLTLLSIAVFVLLIFESDGSSFANSLLWLLYCGLVNVPSVWGCFSFKTDTAGFQSQMAFELNSVDQVVSHESEPPSPEPLTPTSPTPNESQCADD